MKGREIERCSEGKRDIIDVVKGRDIERYSEGKRGRLDVVINLEIGIYKCSYPNPDTAV